MHLPDAILSGPAALGCGAIAACGMAICLRQLRHEMRERTAVLMGMMAAFVFAAQMVNFPVFPGVSGHLLGGVLASVVLGPWAGAVSIGAVLIVQALLFADGGLTALGANFVNMGVIGAGIGYALYVEIRKLAGGGRSGTLIGAVVAAWISVILSAGACAAELAASGRGDAFLTILGWMALVHALIGVGEAVITGLILQAILQVRPDLIPECEVSGAYRRWRWGRLAVAGLGVSLAVAVFLAPFASSWPDGLEFVGDKLAIQGPPSVLQGERPTGEAASEHAALPSAFMAEYQLPIPGVDSLRVATAAAGAVGSVAVFAFATVLGRTIKRRERPSAA